MSKTTGIKIITIFVFAFWMNLASFSQGLPPGWDYLATPTTHIVSIKLSVNPNINGYAINPGDYIGVFYLDNNGVLKCGGAVEWLGNQNTAIIAFGDDSFTTQKDGFSSGELIRWKVYSWSVEKAYDAVVTCDNTLLSSCTNFVPNGLAGLETFDATGFFMLITALPDIICQGDLVQLTAIPSGGTGNYVYSWSSVPPGFTSGIANPQAFPVVNTQYIVQVNDGTEVISLQVSVIVISPPQVQAGYDQTVCENETVFVNGSVENENSFIWTTNGDGQFADPLSLSTEYAPGEIDIENESVLLSLTAQPNEPCLVAQTDQLGVSFQLLPTVNAGDDFLICEGQSVMLLPEVLNSSSILWESNGDGVFDNPTVPETTYTPGNIDVLTGSVTLSITVLSISPCNAQAVDFLDITFGYLPTVNVGEDLIICQSNNVSLTASAENYSTSEWTTSGDGSFDNTGLLNTNYFPGPADVLNGNVMLTLTVGSVLPCTTTVSDLLELDIVKNPVVIAGSDATVCAGLNPQVVASALNFDEILWSTEGDGTFDDQFSLITFYYPGALDIANEFVLLKIEAFPQFPCFYSSEDFVELQIQPNPTANAGDDATIYSDDTYQCAGIATNNSSVFWSTGGDGLFDDQSLTNATYTPGSGDISEGSVELIFEALPVTPCLVSVYDQMMLTIDSVTGVNDYSFPAKFTVYPNPATSVLNIKCVAYHNEIFLVRIFDNFGHTAYSSNISFQHADQLSSISLGLDGLPDGVYFLELTGKESKQIKKFVKKSE